MNSKLRILSAMLAVIMIFSVVFVGCSKDDENSAGGEESRVLHVPKPKPIEKITLKALQASVPADSPIEKHSLEFQIPEKLDKDYDAEAYFNYRVKYSLDDYKMADATIEKKLDEIYAGSEDVWFIHAGDEVFQISDTSWGIIKTVQVRAFTDNGILKEEIKFVLTGLEEK